MLSVLQNILSDFFLLSDIPWNAKTGVYAPRLVVLSYFIAFLGAFTSLRLASDIYVARSNRRKNTFHLLGALSLGAGIWSMHFIGMLAYDMEMYHAYDPLLTVVSMLIAIGSAAAVFNIIRQKEINPKQLFKASLLLGLAICGMHYMGMEAMVMDADLRYVPSLFFVSLAIAVTASAAALKIIFFLREYDGNRKYLWEILAAIIVAIAICGMHYTGMAASVFIPYADCRLDPYQSYESLALIVSSVSGAIFMLALTINLNKIALNTAKKVDQFYSGRIVFFQLSALLSVFVILILGGYFFFETSVQNHKNDDSIVNASGLQRMLLVRYANHTSIALMAHVIEDQKLLDKNVKIALETKKYINKNYQSLIHGGSVLVRGDGSETIDIDGFFNTLEIRDQLSEARKEWDYLASISNNILEKNIENFDVESFVKDPRHQKLNDQVYFVLDEQDKAVKLIQAHFDRDKNELLLKQRIVLSLGLIVFVLTLFYAKFFIANPIEIARKKLRDVNKDLEKRVHEQTEDLMEAILEMEVSRNEAHRLNDQMQIYTDKLEEARLEAIAAKEKAEEANQAKSDFLANMSHEIRTPMNAILGMSRMLLDDNLTPPQKENAQAIKSSGDTLLHIINDIIDISKIEAGKLILEEVKFDFLEVIQEVATLYSYQAREKRIEMILDIQADITGHFWGDPVRVKQIFANLISNALKFTSKGHILIRVRKGDIEYAEGGQVELLCTIEDTGIGIPKEKHQKIFQKFSQAEVSTTRKFGGTGLGLAIVSQLIEMMEGQIRVESIEGEGSKFIFNILLKQKEKEEIDSLDTKLKDIRVMIIDDYDLTREILSSIFHRRNIEFLSFLNAEDALEHLEKTNEIFDVCLVDYSLGGMNGLSFVQEIRKKKQHQKLALVMISGVLQKPYRELKEIGLDGFLGKPSRLEHILIAIQQAIYNRQNQITDAALITRHNCLKVLNKEELDQENIFQNYSGKRVLAVDDTKLNMLVIKNVLKKFDLDIDIAENGVQAVEKVTDNSYDIIFMDCQMPEMDGFEATTKIRELELEEKRKEVPIIALTADAMIGDREKCLSYGMNDYINKPFEESDIAKVLARWIPQDNTEPDKEK